tara:strand:- start:522 stop:809 length:288 start_codon:yes stop_codon:yes gene_type:complete
MESANVVRVTIFGQEYVIKTSADPKYIKDVAAYVNSKMNEIKDSGLDVDSQQLKIAVLASMNITDELFSIRNNSNEFANVIEGQTNHILELVNQK